MNADILNVTDDEFKTLLGREIPSGELEFINKKKNRINVGYNTTVIELKYAKGWVGRLFSGAIRLVINLAKVFGNKAWANTLIMGVVHQPMRGLSRMTGGIIHWEQLNGLIDMFNGHFFRGLAKFFKEGKKIKQMEKLKKLEEKNPEKAKKLKEKLEAKRLKEERKAKLKAMSKEEKAAFLANEKEQRIAAFNASEIEHSEQIAQKRQTLKEQGKSEAWLNFTQLGFYQGIRKWWNKFSHLHPVASHWIYQIVFFLVFSNGVTIWQFLVMLFLPYAFASLSNVEFIWPQVSYTWFDGATLTWGIFNEPIKYAEDGITVIVGGGLGNFIAFEIAVFTAQCINFPLQRNITFRSNGNPWWQGLWYFIGWVLISIGVNALWGFVGPVADHYLVDVWHLFINQEACKWLTDLLKTFITGGISMVIFFFIFKIIFPTKKEANS
jgi:hypothetical protein